jgi:hypothetical protein
MGGSVLGGLIPWLIVKRKHNHTMPNQCAKSMRLSSCKLLSTLFTGDVVGVDKRLHQFMTADVNTLTQ